MNLRNESRKVAETAYAVCTALEHAEGRIDVRRYFFNFVNSLPFVLPKEEVMTLVNTSRVRHRQLMHMADRRCKETAKQWQQGNWRLIALKRLLRQAPDGHESRRVHVSRLSEETAGTVGSQKRKR